MRRLFNLVLPYPSRISRLLPLLRKFDWLLPSYMRNSIPARKAATTWPDADHPRRMVMLSGCVQSVTHPDINIAAARLMDRLGISLIKPDNAGCCGAISYHLTSLNDAKTQMRRNIDTWWPEIERGAEAVVATSSACAAMIKDYGHILRDDSGYAVKAEQISVSTRDIAEVLGNEDLSALRFSSTTKRVACHVPCSLQHGQHMPDAVDRILIKCGFEVTPVPDAHLCCGAAGTYSLLQHELSSKLLANKLAALESGSPQCIVTANIGCLIHLQGKSKVPVQHWTELLESCVAS